MEATVVDSQGLCGTIKDGFAVSNEVVFIAVTVDRRRADKLKVDSPTTLGGGRAFIEFRANSSNALSLHGFKGCVVATQSREFEEPSFFQYWQSRVRREPFGRPVKFDRKCFLSHWFITPHKSAWINGRVCLPHHLVVLFLAKGIHSF
nr:MAG TPA: hypothetical protein [Caudoviricetes sp.]